MVYKKVRLAYDINDDYDTHPSEWLYSIGRNVSYIQYCEIRFQTYHYTPMPLATLLENPEYFDTHFAFYNALCILYDRGNSLRVLDVSVGRPRLPELPRSYTSLPRPANDHLTTPWRYDMCTEQDSEATRREFFPEIFFTLGLLKGFGWVERIIISDPERERLFSPNLPYYLRGELGFDFDRVSTRADERWEYQEMGWSGEGPGFEYWELVNLARRGVQGRPDAEVAGRNRTWTLSAFQERYREMSAQVGAW